MQARVVNTANQISDILQYQMDNRFIMYCSCVGTIVTCYDTLNTINKFIS